MSPSARTAAIAELIGRDAESALLDELIDGLPDAGGALIVRGEAGIGKSALLQRARERVRARGGRVLATVGVESEAELAFAGLHQLLHPINGLTEHLSEAQRRAIDAAFGVSGELEPDPFRLALAAFQLVCDAADAGPVVLIVDDAQWLDHSSMGALTFIARRLESEPVVLVAAVRAGHTTLLDGAHLPTLDLERLSAPAAAILLDQTAPELHPILRARVLSEAAGNPLALVELARMATNAAGEHERIAPAPTTLTARLEQAFASRLRDLPAVTCAALLVAALDSRVSLEEIVRCVQSRQETAASVGVLEPAVDAALIEVAEGAVRFRHPLIRSAVRQAAGPALVQATYAALASIVDEPERSLWHRAMAAEGPDEEIATALELHARAARRRGAVTVAGAALERAAALTGDTHRKTARVVEAAEIAYELGLASAVHRLIQQAETLDLDAMHAARLAWLQQMVTGNVWYEPGATRTFVTIAEQMRNGGDPDMALRSLVPIAHRCWWTQTQTRTRQYLVDAAMNMGIPDDDPRVLAVIALADPENTGAAVRERVARIRLHESDDPIAVMDIGIAADKAGDFAASARFLTRAVERLREQVRLGPLAQALVHLAWVALHTGDWGVAAAASAEGARLARDTRQPQYGLTGELIAALVIALRGTEQDLEAVIAQTERTLQSMKGGPLLATAHLARGAAAIGEGRHEEALGHLWPVFDDTQPAFHRFMRWSALLDLVEAGAGSGQADRLLDLVDELEHLAAASGSPFLQAKLIAVRPLLAPDADAEQLFVAAVGNALKAYPFLEARTLFSFGRWLRRRRRSADARAPLRQSIEVFDMLGATQWSKRARQELRATGVTIGQRTPDARDRLTAQELQIAHLAAEGLSNREIGERLFLSHRTVSGHLYRIFPKLGISGRAQLRNALVSRVS
jgi:DNA-binding CsgD family transcriptional regulator